MTWYKQDDRILDYDDMANVFALHGYKGLGIMWLLIQLLHRYFLGDVNEPIVLQISHMSRYLFPKITNYKFLERVLQTANWEFKKTSSTYIFAPNLHTQAFAYQNTKLINSKKKINKKENEIKENDNNEKLEDENNGKFGQESDESQTKVKRMSDECQSRMSLQVVECVTNTFSTRQQEEEKEKNTNLKNYTNKSHLDKVVQFSCEGENRKSFELEILETNFPESKIEITNFDAQIAEKMLAHIKTLTTNKQVMNNVNIQQWQQCIAKLRDKGYTEQDIVFGLTYAFQSDFWKTRLQSPSLLLRVNEKNPNGIFETILRQSKSKSVNTGNNLEAQTMQKIKEGLQQEEREVFISERDKMNKRKEYYKQTGRILCN